MSKMNNTKCDLNICKKCQAEQYPLIEDGAGMAIAVATYCPHNSIGGVYIADIDRWFLRRARTREEFTLWAARQAMALVEADGIESNLRGDLSAFGSIVDPCAQCQLMSERLYSPSHEYLMDVCYCHHNAVGAVRYGSSSAWESLPPMPLERFIETVAKGVRVSEKMRAVPRSFRQH